MPCEAAEGAGCDIEHLMASALGAALRIGASLVSAPGLEPGTY